MPDLNSSESVTRDNLFAGTQTMPVVSGAETVVSGSGVVVRGSVMGRITTGGKINKIKLVDATSVDGSEAAYCIMAETVDATSADVVAQVYYTGEFNTSALTFGSTDTYSMHRTNMRKMFMFGKTIKA